MPRGLVHNDSYGVLPATIYTGGLISSQRRQMKHFYVKINTFIVYEVSIPPAIIPKVGVLAWLALLFGILAVGGRLLLTLNGHK